MSEINFYVIANHLGDLCKQKQIQIALAESCTGGGVSASLTEISGSSEWFLGSAVTYSNAAKEKILHVETALLDEHGAVSELVARAMAEGALKIFNADVTVSLTGVAGPTGGTAEKPVGMVCFALADRTQRTCIAKTMHFDGGRNCVRKNAALFALDWLTMHIATL